MPFQRVSPQVFGAFVAVSAAATSSADPAADPKPRVDASAARTGDDIAYFTRPTYDRETRACSTRFPLCVHAADRRDWPAAKAALPAFERAWETLTGGFGVPAPDPDPFTLAYDVFVGDDNATRLEARDVRSRVDRGRTFTTLDRRMRAGCSLDAAALYAIARASLYGVAPATEEGTAIAQAEALTELALPCAAGLNAGAVTTFQQHADLAFADAHAGAAFDRGAALFWTWLDRSFGRQPGLLLTTTWALHPTMTPVPSARWFNEPDTFDVLRLTFQGALSTGNKVDDLWLDFGVARAFTTDGDAAATVPLSWDIPWPTTPRRLAPLRPVAPTGASYILVHHAGAQPGARLRVEIAWEEHALFRWTLVKLDATGHELGRVPIATKERATEAQMSLVLDDAVDRVLVVGVNAGDPAYAFDPDDDVLEPHGFTVTVAAEE